MWAHIKKTERERERESNSAVGMGETQTNMLLRNVLQTSTVTLKPA